jgi:hypothetical protein
MWDFVMDIVALVQVFSEYFGFPCQFSFYQFLHNHHHLSSGAGTIGQQWPQYQETQSRPTKNNNNNHRTVKGAYYISLVEDQEMVLKSQNFNVPDRYDLEGVK